jgi:hypothetical protein
VIAVWNVEGFAIIKVGRGTRCGFEYWQVSCVIVRHCCGALSEVYDYAIGGNFTFRLLGSLDEESSCLGQMSLLGHSGMYSTPGIFIVYSWFASLISVYATVPMLLTCSPEAMPFRVVFCTD